jgi:hypothetical protein
MGHVTPASVLSSMLGVLDPGDEIVIFEPYYENYGPDSILAGAIPRDAGTSPPGRTRAAPSKQESPSSERRTPLSLQRLRWGSEATTTRKPANADTVRTAEPTHAIPLRRLMTVCVMEFVDKCDGMTGPREPLGRGSADAGTCTCDDRGRPLLGSHDSMYPPSTYTIVPVTNDAIRDTRKVTVLRPPRLHALIRLEQAASTAGCRLQLARLRPSVRRPMDIAGLAPLFESATVRLRWTTRGPLGTDRRAGRLGDGACPEARLRGEGWITMTMDRPMQTLEHSVEVEAPVSTAYNQVDPVWTRDGRLAW